VNNPQVQARQLSRAADTFAAEWLPRVAAADDVEKHLCERDPQLGRLVRAVVARSGARRFRSARLGTHYDGIARAIIYQQLSGQAAGTIYNRVVAAVGGKLSPAAILATPMSKLRRAGVSGMKARALRELALRVERGELPLRRLSSLPDDMIWSTLTEIPGVGPWTTQMFLMFRLRRLDVLPVGDTGVRRGLQFAYRLRRMPDTAYVTRVGQRWRPYRSIACLYLWSALDLRLTQEDL